MLEAGGQQTSEKTFGETCQGRWAAGGPNTLARSRSNAGSVQLWMDVSSCGHSSLWVPVLPGSRSNSSGKLLECSVLCAPGTGPRGFPSAAAGGLQDVPGGLGYRRALSLPGQRSWSALRADRDQTAQQRVVLGSWCSAMGQYRSCPTCPVLTAQLSPQALCGRARWLPARCLVQDGPVSAGSLPRKNSHTSARTILRLLSFSTAVLWPELECFSLVPQGRAPLLTPPESVRGAGLAVLVL